MRSCCTKDFKRFMAPLFLAGVAGAGRQSHQGPFIHPFHDHDDMSLYILSMLLKLSKLLCYSRIAKTSKVCTIFERQPSLLQPSKAEYQVVKAITLFSETYVYHAAAAARALPVLPPHTPHKGLKSPKRFTNLPSGSISSILN